MNCELCDHDGGEVLWRDASCRVVYVDEVGYRGFCRVIWGTHVKEMTDLPEHQRVHLMRVVFSVEAAVRQTLHPLKVNLASLGNITPHIHWHVIPRFVDDPHFPNSVWGSKLRTPATPIDTGIAAALRSAIGERLKGSK